MYVYRCPKCPAHVSLGTHGRPPVCVPCDYSMARVEEGAAVLLPLDPAAPAYGFTPLKVEYLKSAGIRLPETQHALEWLYRHRDTNGMAQAFRKVGGRRCIDLVAFARLVREGK